MPDQTALRRARLASTVSAFNFQRDKAATDTGMNVSGIRVYSLREPRSGRRYTVLKVATESGHFGFGECEAVSAAELAKATQVATGKPATAYEVIRQQLLALPGLQAAINVALLDILGKKAKAPIYQVLGGPTRLKARASAVLEGESDEALVASMKEAQGAGFRAFLVPIPRVRASNQGQTFVQATRKRLDSLRRRVGTASILFWMVQEVSLPATLPVWPMSWSTSTCCGLTNLVVFPTWLPPARLLQRP